jgi:hypothetical protein
VAGEEGLYKLVHSKKVGDVCSLLIRRDTFEKTLRVTVNKVDRIKCTITPGEKINQEQRQIRDSWMTGQ